jgi:biotin synthase
MTEQNEFLSTGEKWQKRVEEILQNKILSDAEAWALADISAEDWEEIFPAAAWLREQNFQNKVHLCTIMNAKSGKCSEDCSFCSQSIYAETDAPIYPLESEEAIQDGALRAEKGGIHRYSVVTSGRALPDGEVQFLASSLEKLKDHKTKYCASLGTLDKKNMQVLADSGITRYHHNLEASASYYPEICTTHAYEERVRTIKDAQAAGLSVCAGGIFGIGESDKQVVEMALALRELNVDSVPVNFLMPIEGTRLATQNPERITPERALRIIAIFRLILSDKDILVCGGRVHNLGERHREIFAAGASGMMTGNYLTRGGRTLDDDLEMLASLGMSIR